MTERDQIEVDKEDLPYQFDLDVENTTYTFSFQYNDVLQVFTVDLYDSDGNAIILGEPLILNQPLWYGRDDERLPVWDIVPMDESGQTTELTYDNFGVSVFLLIDDLVAGDEDGS